MRRRHTLWLLLTLVACAPAAEPRRPIVLVVIDTLRSDVLSMYGGAARTPQLDALAEAGIARPALASFHQTSMSMGALFTGRTPSLESQQDEAALAWRPVAWCGMGRFAADPDAQACLPPGLPTLGEKLESRGYVSVGVVANALLHEPAGFARGFARWAEVGRSGASAERRRRPAHAQARLAAQQRGWEHVHEALRRELEDLPEAPLFLYVHYLDVHDWLHLERSYVESVERMDRGIGELLAILREHELLPGAALLITSDHGELIDDRPRVLPHHPLHLGNPAFREVLDVPFLLVGGGGVPLPPLIRSEDVHRILLALAGEPLGASADLLPDELLVSEKHFRTYQRGGWKSIWPRGGGGGVLVDLAADPGETRDVSSQQPERLREHRARVDALAAALAADGLPSEPAPLDPEWSERLRGLGYLE